MCLHNCSNSACCVAVPHASFLCHELKHAYMQWIACETEKTGVYIATAPRVSLSFMLFY